MFLLVNGHSILVFDNLVNLQLTWEVSRIIYSKLYEIFYTQDAIPEEVGSVHMSFILDCIFDLVFHVSLNSCNPKLKNSGVRWGPLHTGIALHVSFKKIYFVL